MINFINKFLSSLSDVELMYLRDELFEEEHRRLQEKTRKTGMSLELSESEIALLKEGRKIQAIKEYRARNGVSLKVAKDRVEEYFQSFCSGCAMDRRFCEIHS